MLKREGRKEKHSKNRTQTSSPVVNQSLLLKLLRIHLLYLHRGYVKTYFWPLGHFIPCVGIRQVLILKSQNLCSATPIFVPKVHVYFASDVNAHLNVCLLDCSKASVFACSGVRLLFLSLLGFTNWIFLWLPPLKGLVHSALRLLIYVSFHLNLSQRRQSPVFNSPVFII